MNGQGLARLWLAIGLAIALSYTTSSLALSAPNECSRLYLTVALFEQGSYRIDAVREHFGPVVDEAVSGGHFFSDKAPGASLLAVIPYAVLRQFIDERRVSIHVLLAIGRYAIMVPIGVATFFALEGLCSALSIGRAATRWASLAYLLGTPAFHYSAAFFGHQIVAACFVAAFWLVVRQRGVATKSAYVQLALAGALLGMAGITEYQALIGVVILTLYVAHASRGRRCKSLLAYLIGGLPFAAWLASYHTSCFGGPFELSYHHLSQPMFAEAHRHGLGGVSGPTVAGLTGVLLSWHRGLLANSPFLLLAPLGCWGLLRRGEVALAIVFGATPLLFIGFVASSITWDAGWGYGCRLLVPVLPILALLVAEGLDRARNSNVIWGLAVSALLVSFLSFQVVTALFAEPPNDLHNPWLDLVLPLGSRSLVAANLGSIWFGLHGWYSLVPQLLVLGGLLMATLRATLQCVQSRIWLAWVPLCPILWTIAIVGRGRTLTDVEQSSFIDFARSIDPVSALSSVSTLFGDRGAAIAEQPLRLISNGALHR
jgi:hypothetical protein